MAGKYAKGLVHDTPDPNDFLLQEHPKFTAAMVFGLPPLPPSVDMRPMQSPVYDQGNLGQCTGEMGRSFREWMEKVTNLSKTKIASYTPLSNLALYYIERMIEGTTDQDSGAMIRTTCKAIQKYGVPPLVDYADDINQFTTVPSPQALTDALLYRVPNYYKVKGSRQLARTLAWGHCVMIGVDVFESFEDDKTINSGFVPMPEAGEQLLGGHALLCVAYQTLADGTRLFIVKNSWGLGIGLKGTGYFALPEAYINHNAPDGERTDHLGNVDDGVMWCWRRRILDRLHAIENVLDYLTDLVETLTQKEEATMVALDDLTAQVTENTNLEASAIQLIQNIAAQLAAAGTDPVKLAALQTQLKTSADALAAAITANTVPAPPTP